jgi:hypothetical protein
MATRVVRITGSDINNGQLELSDRGHTKADPGDTIQWQIEQNSGVDSIVSIQEKSDSENIWASPPRLQGSNWTGAISSTSRPYDAYVYSITWRRGSVTKVCDPIISIKPTSSQYSLLLGVIAGAAAGFIAALFCFNLWAPKTKKKWWS